MPTQQNKVVYLKNYEPPAFLIDSVKLTFKLSPSKTRVTSEIRFKPNSKSSTKVFFLMGEELSLIWAKVDGILVSPTKTKNGLTCKVPEEPFVWESEVEIQPDTNTRLEGLYISNGMYTTQCEAEGFRRITYYPDRPDVLAKFQVRIESTEPILLSNGNLIDSGPGFAEWYDPWPKPSYLFALVAGTLVKYSDHYKSRSGLNVDLNIWVRSGDEDKCDFAMNALKKAMKWDEVTYEREYDLNLFNIVAVDDFNMGAMENKGLNIFNSSAVLASPETSTDQNYERIESIIAHEYFHNWTGNRVTCRDWFQLCLKEGLTVFRDQQFTSDIRSESVKRINDVLDLRAIQFREDGGPLAHPVRPESYIEINNFYTSTIYEKGAEIIRMLQLLVGKENYYKAVNLYFSRHDGEACTVEDWLRCFEDITKRDLTQFKLWYLKPGTPEINVEEKFHSGCYTLKLTQQSSNTSCSVINPMLLPVAIGLLDTNGKEILSTTVLELYKTTQQFEFKDLDSKPIVSLLRGFSAPVKLSHKRPDKEYALLIKNDTDPFNRWEASRFLSQKVLLSATGSSEEIETIYLDAIKDIVTNNSIEPALKSLMLKLPTQGELAKEILLIGESPDPLKIYLSIKELERLLALKLEPYLLQLYSTNFVTGNYKSNARDDGKRALRAIILKLITKIDSGVTATKQFKNSSTMQEQLGALGCLIECNQGEKEIISFFNQWSGERLVMDKWFAIQVLKSSPEKALEKVKTLTEHKLFDMTNPNRFRAVFGSLTANSVAFHQLSGHGYELLANWIIKLDQINPQTAARMSTAFDTWKIYDTKRKNLIKTQLNRIQNQANLSKDTSEIIERILM
ncbi:MAG: aminopeptidase N [Rhodobacteraceae bacterium]|nr:aminopeptidase N [Paracoccaceae bacterium]